MNCKHVLDFSDFKRVCYNRELRCHIGSATCPECGTRHRLCLRWFINYAPPGGKVCNNGEVELCVT